MSFHLRVFRKCFIRLLTLLALSIFFVCPQPGMAQAGLATDPVIKNQLAAIDAMEAINEAEMTYATTFEHGFSHNLKALAGRTASPATAQAAGLIDNELGSGGKGAYTFTYTTSVSGGRPGTYTVNANPVGGAGSGSFYFTDQSGVIRENKTAPATVSDPPMSIIIKFDPALDELIAPDAQVDILADMGISRGALTEGPVWDRRQGYLLFSDVPDNAIYKWTPDGKVAVFLKPSGYTGTGRSEAKLTHNGRSMVHLVGSVGMKEDLQGRVVFCAQGDRAIVRLEKDGKRTILADKYEGKRLNSPNDMIYKSDGALYFSDPYSGFQNGHEDSRRELDYEGIFLLKDGKLYLMDKYKGRSNGLVLSYDEKNFYALDKTNDTIMRFKVLPDDTIADGEVFADLGPDTKTPDGKDLGGPDGMTVDSKGNVYCSSRLGFWIISPEGKHLGTIRTPRRLTNFAFGGADGKTLFMTTHTGELLRLQLKVAGLRPY
jgi:sugar lactone lactonase YvrE